MEELLKYITTQITGNEDIAIDESESDGIRIYTIKAPKEVMGLLIGKEGRTIRAIRLLARARAIKEKTNIRVELQERD
ncbi:MAG: KH domain-containing protein [Candidatus Blackburnbacteria bacterium]|nr:KH domain-containing protein [Candidatus Blackburnbacteria bacterium]